MLFMVVCKWVFKQLGGSFLEMVYGDALNKEQHMQGLQAESQVEINVL